MKWEIRNGLLLLSLLLVIVSTGLIGGCSREGQIKIEVKRIRYANFEPLPEQVASHQRVVDAFNQRQSKVKVKFEPVQGGRQKILIEIAGGTAPDVFFWSNDILAPLVIKKAVIDLKPYIEASKVNLDDYFPGLFDALSFNNGIYAFPLYWGSEVLAYNKDLFDQAGLSYPDDKWTWDDFLKAAEKLTIRKGGTVQFGTTRPFEYALYASYGGNIFNQDGTKCTVDSPEARKALQFLVDLEKKHQVVPALTEFGRLNKYREEMQMFMTGRVAMFFISSFVISTVNQIKDFRWDVAPLPKGKDKRRTPEPGQGILCISSQTKYPQEAWEFVKFACGKEGEKYLVKNCISSLKEVAYTNFCTPPPQHVRIFIDQIEEIMPNPIAKKIWREEFMGTIYRPELDKLFLGIQTVDETVRNIVAGADKFLKQN